MREFSYDGSLTRLAEELARPEVDARPRLHLLTRHHGKSDANSDSQKYSKLLVLSWQDIVVRGFMNFGPINLWTLEQTSLQVRITVYRQPGWVGTDGVNRDTGIEPGETQRQNVSPGSRPASRSTPVDGRGKEEKVKGVMGERR